ncbi:MAG: hypothetical protein DYG98_08380 [Haliscomenobacteraceae bacterium CHB4]|jgi:hypothetical protein|nr:hypothetical protein [Haliscomenobacteraceae bacterium CHB4]
MNLFYQNIPRHPLIVKFPTVQALVEQLYLSAILDAYPRVKSIPGIAGMSENTIRNRVVEDFKFSNPVIREYIQNKLIFIAAENQAYTASLSQRTDLEFHNSIHQHKFVIECKRLSTAEERYVHGRIKNGQYQHDGLEKFVNLTYAAEDNEGAMLSFIVGRNPSEIVNGLNRRVQVFHPSSHSASLSTQLCLGWALSFQSSHSRTDGRPFHLYHLFFNLA